MKSIKIPPRQPYHRKSFHWSPKPCSDYITCLIITKVSSELQLAKFFRFSVKGKKHEVGKREKEEMQTEKGTFNPAFLGIPEVYHTTEPLHAAPSVQPSPKISPSQLSLSTRRSKTSVTERHMRWNSRATCHRQNLHFWTAPRRGRGLITLHYGIVGSDTNWLNVR